MTNRKPNREQDQTAIGTSRDDKVQDGRISQNVFSATEISQNKTQVERQYSTLEAETEVQKVELALQALEELQSQDNIDTEGLQERRRKANTILCSKILGPLRVDWITQRLLDHAGVSIPRFTSWCLTAVHFVDEVRVLKTPAKDLTYKDVQKFLKDNAGNSKTIRWLLGVKEGRSGFAKNKGEKLHHPVIVKFVSSMNAKGTKSNSIYTTVHPIEQFTEWLCRVYVEFNEFDPVTIPVWRINSEHLRDYRRHLQHLVARGDIKDSTAEQYFRRVKTFFNFCYKQRLISAHPMESVPDLSSESTEISLPSAAEVDQFFETILKYSDRPVLDFVAFVGLLILGLRSIELASLKWADIDLRNRLATIWRKGDRIHQMPLPQYFIDCLRLIRSDGQGAVFADNADAFTVDLYNRYRAYEILAGWRRRNGVHIFRHLFVTGLTYSGSDIRSIMFLTNHVNPYILERYIHRSDEECRAAVNSLRLRGD